MILVFLIIDRKPTINKKFYFLAEKPPLFLLPYSC